MISVDRVIRCVNLWVTFELGPWSQSQQVCGQRSSESDHDVRDVEERVTSFQRNCLRLRILHGIASSHPVKYTTSIMFGVQGTTYLGTYPMADCQA